MHDVLRIHSTHDPSEIAFIESLLADDGIDCAVQDEIPLLGGLTMIHISVREADREKALDIIRNMDACGVDMELSSDEELENIEAETATELAADTAPDDIHKSRDSLSSYEWRSRLEEQDQNILQRIADNSEIYSVMTGDTSAARFSFRKFLLLVALPLMLAGLFLSRGALILLIGDRNGMETMLMVLFIIAPIVIFWLMYRFLKARNRSAGFTRSLGRYRERSK